MKTLIVAFAVVILPFIASAKMRYDQNTTTLPLRVIEYKSKHQALFSQGYLDVTKAPYLAVNDGSKDTALALQSAINDAFASNLVVYIPKGTYLINKSLRLFQSRDKLGMGQRKFAHILLGPPGLAVDERPVFKLGASIQGPFIHFAYVNRPKENRLDRVEVNDAGEIKVGEETVSFENLEEDASRHYNAHFRGINIELGNNPGAIGLHMNGAQYCVVENVRISGENFAVGLKNLPGSGGSVTNLEVIGGEVGILQENFRPSPSVHGLRLINQKRSGLEINMVRGSVTIVGFEITSVENAPVSYRGIRSGRPANLINGRIEVKNSTSSAIENANWDFFAKNVSYKAKRFISSSIGQNHLIVDGSPSEERLIEEYIFASNKSPLVIENGKNLQKGEPWHRVTGNLPTTLIKDHAAEVLKNYHLFDFQQGTRRVDPPRDRSGLVDVTLVNPTVEGVATPDNDTDDDAVAINAALRSTLSGENKGKTVFLPRGYYHVRTPIIIPEGTRLIGASNTISVIVVDAERFNFQGDYYSSIVKVEKNDETLKPAILADFAIFAKSPQKDPLVTEIPKSSRISYLRVSGLTQLRDIQFTQFHKGTDTSLFVHAAPTIHFQEGSGGDFYNLGFDEYSATAPKPSYAIMKIEKNSYPINLYQPYLEATGAYSPNLWLQKATQVSLYGYKFEDSGQIARVNSSSKISIIGASGNIHHKDEDIPTKPSIAVSSDSIDLNFVSITPKPEKNGVVPILPGFTTENSILLYKKFLLPPVPTRRVRSGPLNLIP